MKRTLKTIAFLLAILLVLVSCNNSKKTEDDTAKTTPLTLEFIESGELSVEYSNNYGDSDVYYSLNGGERTLLKNKAPIRVSAGEKVVLYRTLKTEKPKYAGATIVCTNDCYVYGNVMSLIDSDNFATLYSVPKNAFEKLFEGNRHIKNHESKDFVLPATTLAERCYESMFYDCTSLTEAPVLPALILAKYCYGYMFAGCTNLTKAPELPATTLDESCYECMFSGCTSLTTAPELPATILAEFCYFSMFDGCTSLTKAPELPATTLVEYCYSGMFSGCKSLSEAPVLPALTLAEGCYSYMFMGCTEIGNITCLAKDISAQYCTDSWLKRVSKDGTFIKSPEARWPSGDSGIPKGWTVQNYSTTSVKAGTDNSKGPAERSFYELAEDEYVVNALGFHIYAGKNPEMYKIFDNHNYTFNQTEEAKKTIINFSKAIDSFLKSIAEENGLDPNYLYLNNIDSSDRELVVLAFLISRLFPDDTDYSSETAMNVFQKYIIHSIDALEYKTYKPSYSEAIYYFKDEYSLNYYFNGALEDATKYYNKMYSEQSELLDNLKKRYMSVEEYRDTLGSYSIFYIEAINRLLSVIDITSSNKPKDYEYALTIFETNGELTLYLIEYESNTATRISVATKSTEKNEWLYE